MNLVHPDFAAVTTGQWYDASEANDYQYPLCKKVDETSCHYVYDQWRENCSNDAGDIHCNDDCRAQFIEIITDDFITCIGSSSFEMFSVASQCGISASELNFTSDGTKSSTF